MLIIHAHMNSVREHSTDAEVHRMSSGHYVVEVDNFYKEKLDDAPNHIEVSIWLSETQFEALYEAMKKAKSHKSKGLWRVEAKS
jgi:hypothetical protein